MLHGKSVEDINSPTSAESTTAMGGVSISGTSMLDKHIHSLLSRRWKMWEPYVTLNVRNGRRRQEQNEDSSDSMISQVQKRHAEGLLKLLKAGVSMDYIKKHNCDNPFQPIDRKSVV